MSEFKWVPEVGMRVKVGNYDCPDYVGVLLPENSSTSCPESEIVILSERKKVILSWSCSSINLTPVGKKSEKHYAKAKKEWEDAQVKVGDICELTEDSYHRYIKKGAIAEVIGFKSFGVLKLRCLTWMGEGSESFAMNPIKIRKLTPAEVAEHETSLKPEFEVGSYWVLLEDQTHFIKKNAFVQITSYKKGQHVIAVQDMSEDAHEHGRWETTITNLRPATPEEIKAATRSVWSLEDGDEHWHLNHKGEVELFEWDSNLASCVKGRERGHVFLTREEAEAEDARRVAANAQDGGGV